MDLPSTTDIRSAALGLEGKARVTPLLESQILNERLGGRLLIKPEMLQVTGSFKFRGAYNFISRIPEDQKKHGVVAFSSGNHAQGVAAASKMFGMRSTIIMPEDAPEIKISNTRALGADVVLYNRKKEARENIGRRITEETGATLIRPYDDPLIIAGQGTIGLEVAAQTRAMGIVIDALLSPCGGGGLVAGTALALADESPDTEIYSVEPEDYDDTAMSLIAGERLANFPRKVSFCDALLAPEPGELTFAINSRLLTGGLAVSDDEVGRAMQVAFREFKVVSEPGGAVALAAALSGAYDITGKTAVVVMSGGNVDGAIFAAALQG